jgi:stage V sporulation protein B
VRLMGAFFRIVLAMLIGDEGVGLFQMAYPVYSTLLAVSTAGIPIAISKLIAEKLARDDYHGAYRIFRVALAILAASGLVISAVLFFSADFLPVPWHRMRAPLWLWPVFLRLFFW